MAQMVQTQMITALTHMTTGKSAICHWSIPPATRSPWSARRSPSREVDETGKYTGKEIKERLPAGLGTNPTIFRDGKSYAISQLMSIGETKKAETAKPEGEKPEGSEPPKNRSEHRCGGRQGSVGAAHGSDHKSIEQPLPQLEHQIVKPQQRQRHRRVSQRCGSKASLTRTIGVKFSKHAMERIQSRGVDMSQQTLDSLNRRSLQEPRAAKISQSSARANAFTSSVCRTIPSSRQ